MPCITEAKISRREADRRGSMWYSWLMSLAMEPVITMATVLLAVGYIHRGHQSGDAQLGTPLGVGAAVDEVDEPLDAAIFPHQGADTGHDDGDDSDVIHGGDAVPITEKIWVQGKAPEATPTIRLSTAPMVRIRNTLTPATAPTRTTR